MKQQITKFILLFIIFGFLLHNFSLVVLPTDILNTIPGLNNGNIEKPNNSLLADPLFQFEPWRNYAKKRIMEGGIPLWNDLNGGGAPFLASPQTQIFYPLNIIYYVFPIELSLILIPLIKYLLFVFFTYLYLRKLNLEIIPSIAGSIFASTGFMLVWLQWPHTNVYLLFPLLLYLAEKYKISSEKKGPILGYSLVYFLGFLGGHPETLFLSSIVHIIYVFLRFRLQIFTLIFSILIAFLLSAFVTFPFLEYLINSSMLHARTTDVYNHTIPLIYIISNIFPFTFGAPHLQFYKPLFGANFQEAVGSYTGIIGVILFLVGIIKLRNNKLIGAWLIIIVISFLLTYNLPFITNLIQSTPLNISANHRLSAFAGFGISVIAAITLEKILKEKKANFKKHTIILLPILGFVFTVPFLILKGRNLEFYAYIIPYLFLFLLTTALFFIQVNTRKIILLFLIFTQTVFILLGYNTISSRNDYYKDTMLTEYLKKLPGSRVLEIGNPNLPPHINMVYGIEIAENNDALGVRVYDEKFNDAFPSKNHWGKVEEVTLRNLQKFGITHIISDFDINLEKINLFKGNQNVFDVNKKIELPITGNGKSLSQIRIIIADFNRVNKCSIEAVIEKENEELRKKSFKCEDTFNGMFYTISIEPLMLVKNERYKLVFYPKNISKDNFIGLFGNDNPYVDLLFSSKDNIFEKKLNYKTLNIFEVPDSKFIEAKSKINIIKNEPERLAFTIESKKNEGIIIKKTNYPGWEAFVNNRKKEIINNNSPFITINVQNGKNYVELNYRPTSFYLGFIVSFFTALVLLVFSIKDILKNNKNIDKEFLSVLKSHNPIRDFLILFLINSLVFTVFSFFMGFLKPFVSVPETTAINWFTFNGYPILIDQIYVLGSLILMVLSTLIYYLWKRKK